MIGTSMPSGVFHVRSPGVWPVSFATAAAQSLSVPVASTSPRSKPDRSGIVMTPFLLALAP